MLFQKTNPTLDRPDTELTFLPLALDSMTQARQGHGFQIYVELIGCKSKGETHIRSDSIDQNPDFSFNYLEDNKDLTAYRSSIDIVRNLVSQPAFAEYLGDEVHPGIEVQSDQQKDDWLKRSVSVSHHLVGSCQMGSAENPDSVVGPDLKVHGIQRLRVADASIMPTVPSANTHAATIMIAEKASDMIKAGWK